MSKIELCGPLSAERAASGVGLVRNSNGRSDDTDDLNERLIDGQAKRYKVGYEDADISDTAYLYRSAQEWFARSRKSLRDTKEQNRWLEVIAVVFPIVSWLRRYDVRRNLLPDILAGVSVAALVVPQGMSYARLAGLPAVYGLYGAFVPVLCYAALGSSRHLAVGPVAVTSLLLGANLPHIIDAPIQDDPNNPHNKHAQELYNHAAIQVAFVAGCLYTAVGFLNLGWVMNFISHSVIAGFMTGASVIIGLSQVKYLFGYNKRPNPASSDVLKLPSVSFPRHDPVHQQLDDLLGPAWRPYFQWREFVMSVAWITILMVMKNIGKRSPKLVFVRAAGPITVCVLSIAISNIFKLWEPPHNIRVIGVVPAGLPHETVSWWFPMANPARIIGLAIEVCLIDVLESISIAKALAYKNHYQLRATQELRGLGIANLVGCMFNCYTTTGSFSRSAIMDDVNAKTQLAGIVSGTLVMVVLLCLTPVFRNMPQNAQGCIIIAAVIGLFNYSECIFLWKVNKADWVVFMAAALGTMFAGVDIGLGISIGLSIFLALWKSAFPHTAVLGRLPQTTVYRNVKQYPEARTMDGLLLVRIDAPLYFANVNPIKEALDKYERRAVAVAAKKGKPLQYICVDLSPVSDIDASAIHFLKEWVMQVKSRGIQPVFANPSRKVVRLLHNAHLPGVIGEDFITVRIHDAVLLCQELMAERGGVPAAAHLPTAQREAEEVPTFKEGKDLL